VAPLCEELFFRVLLQGWLEKLVSAAAPDAFLPDSSRGDAEAAPPGDAPARAPAIDSEQENNPYAAPQAITRRPAGEDQNRVTFRAIPAVASAFTFALLHVGQGPAPIPLFFFALVLGYLYQKTHRIWPSLVLHFLLNSVSLVVLWIETTPELF
jgi:hypothetical protein